MMGFFEGGELFPGWVLNPSQDSNVPTYLILKLLKDPMPLGIY